MQANKKCYKKERVIAKKTFGLLECLILNGKRRIISFDYKTDNSIFLLRIVK